MINYLFENQKCLSRIASHLSSPPKTGNDLRGVCCCCCCRFYISHLFPVSLNILRQNLQRCCLTPMVIYGLLYAACLLFVVVILYCADNYSFNVADVFSSEFHANIVKDCVFSGRTAEVIAIL